MPGSTHKTTLSNRFGLTIRQAETVDLVALGTPLREVAKRLGVSYDTVKNLLSQSYVKMGVKDRVGAVLAWKSDNVLLGAYDCQVCGKVIVLREEDLRWKKLTVTAGAETRTWDVACPSCVSSKLASGARP